LQGEPEVTCLESGIWSSGPPTCKAVRCPDLRRPSHGSVSHPRHPSYQEEATYSCDNGYGVAGRSTRVCLASGSWSGVAPTCEKGLCDELENPQNGEVSSSSNKVGADVTYSCFHGYRLIGSPKRECLASGDWSVSAPRCEPSHCSNITMPRNMHISQTNGNFVFSVATHSCPEGYILFGSAVRECQPSGIWNGQVPACFPIHCPRLLPPVNGDLTLSNRRCYRSEAVYSCRDGFELRGDMIRTCQNTSQWSGEEPSCVRVIVQCDPLPNITNGQVRVDSRDIGSVAVYSCNEGYGLDGDSLRTCTADGVWSGREPSCNIDRVVMCEALLDPAFGEVVSRSNVVGSIATYECLPGYVLSGDRTRICMRNGMWTGDPPTCQPVNCGRLDAPRNGVIVVSDTTLGAVAIYTCDLSFTLIGVESRICQENGSWSGGCA
jgi:CUB/sushi domain-containing protein